MITSTGQEELKDVIAYLAEVPYDVARRSLYHPAELYEGFDPEDESSFDRCFDSVIYQRYKAMGQHTNAVLQDPRPSPQRGHHGRACPAQDRHDLP